MQKPSSIDLTAGLMAIFIVLGIVSAFMMGPVPLPPNVASNPMFNSGMLTSMAHGLAICGALIAAICVFFYWKGHEWARWIVMIDAVFVLLGLFTIHKTFSNSHLSGFVVLAKSILAIYLLWNLNTAPVKAWFKGPKAGELAA
jgi:hypothetical protein